MSSVGTYLRELRQRRGVSLEEIARTTRVAQRYLESIEADAFAALPSPVFTRGFIRAYCQALSQPPDEALAAYERREPDAEPVPATPSRLGATGSRAVAFAPRSAGSAPRMGGAAPLRSAAGARTGEGEPRGRGAVLVSFVLLVVLGVALFVVALVIHPRERGERAVLNPRPEPRAESRPVRPPAEPMPSSAVPMGSTSAPAATSAATRVTTPSVPGAAATPTPAPMPSPAVTPGPPAPGATPGTPSAPRPAPAPATGAPPTPVAAVVPPATPSLDVVIGSVASPYRLVARTNETTWIRVRTEDGRTSEENVPPGEIREWISNRPFVLSIGNAGGVSFELNGRALPPLGPKGVVIQRIVLPPDAR